MKKKVVILSALAVLGLIVGYYALFYPYCIVQHLDNVIVITPSATRLFDDNGTYSNDYKKDCLHPCIRYFANGFLGYHYWMVQSPYYAKNNQMENPILYKSNDYLHWDNGVEVAPTPQTGYNSDPCLFYEDSVLYVFWRECNTPLCDSMHVQRATVGVSTRDGVNFSDKHVYLLEPILEQDREQCPILVRLNDKYYFYAAWYGYRQERKMKGIAIWEGTSLQNPDFVLTDTIAVQTPYVRDRWLPGKRFGAYCYLPKPTKYDLWHFDLYTHRDTLFMVSCSEGSDNIMLSYSIDGRNFSTYRTALINSHALEPTIGYRQRYYKPSAFVKEDTVHLFFTANDKTDPLQNVLYHAVFK